MALTITSDTFVDPHFLPKVEVERHATSVMIVFRYQVSEPEHRLDLTEGDEVVGSIWLGATSGRIWGIHAQVPQASVVMFGRLRGLIALATEYEQEHAARKSVLNHYETVEASMDFDGFGPQNHWLHPVMFPAPS